MGSPCICTECGQPCDYDHSCEKLRAIEEAVKLFAPDGSLVNGRHATSDGRVVQIICVTGGKLLSLTGHFTAAELKAIAHVMERSQ